jgi:hypothetical protein
MKKLPYKTNPSAAQYVEIGDTQIGIIKLAKNGSLTVEESSKITDILDPLVDPKNKLSSVKVNEKLQLEVVTLALQKRLVIDEAKGIIGDKDWTINDTKAIESFALIEEIYKFMFEGERLRWAGSKHILKVEGDTDKAKEYAENYAEDKGFVAVKSPTESAYYVYKTLEDVPEGFNPIEEKKEPEALTTKEK